MAENKPKDFDLLKEIRDRFREAYTAMEQASRNLSRIS